MVDEATTERMERAGRDIGAAFIEMLVSIVLLGIAAVAILTATTTAITGARTSDQIAKTQAGLAEAADYLTDTEPENVVYQSCLTPNVSNTYQLALDSHFGPGEVEVVDVLFEDQTDTVDGFGTTCRYPAPQGDRLQKVRLRTDTNGSTREVDVIKRPIDTPTVSTNPAPQLPAYAGGSGQAEVSVTPNLP